MKSNAELCYHDQLQTTAQRLFKSKRANRSPLQFSKEIENAWIAIRNNTQDENEIIFPSLPVYDRLPHPEASRIPINLAFLFSSMSIDFPHMINIGSSESHMVGTTAPTERSNVRKLLSLRGSGASEFQKTDAMEGWKGGASVQPTIPNLPTNSQRVYPNTSSILYDQIKSVPVKWSWHELTFGPLHDHYHSYGI
ncbi:hypothetical protein M422DRAFT_46435 [Sphaerobolus stellatus SS14]|uniref:Unplaced genomic scaffold SPHSTscaffold_35, whole genome shotgun sequence n=1 Tax=Sphaerobolus stellatus (strain SS14) TaxID=990650 RepID=A0A0C9USN1_SPHS4|nr:hypothetical protein M422DRAFT_46435 [Sphaerobolus stellatus SS14]